MATITVTKVDFGNTATPGQTFRIEYKLFSASTWTLGSASKTVDADGNLSVPLAITGLTAGQLYYVRASNNCESPPEYYTQQVQL